MSVSLYPHQQDAVNKLSNGKILYGGVGTGKSITAVAYYMQKEAPKNILVITTAKKRDSLDWEGEFIKFGVGANAIPGQSGVLRVDSWNNVARYKNLNGWFVIFDEQRAVGKGAWAKAFVFIAKRNNWILLTATPGDTWMDYVPVFIANGFYKNRTEFDLEHVVYASYVKFPKVERYIDEGRLNRHRASLLVHMPYIKHTVRHSRRVHVDYDKELLDRVMTERWHVYEDRPIRDVAEYFTVMRKVVNSDASRARAVKTLLEAHPRLIVFYNFNYELDALRKLAEPDRRVLNAKYTGKNPHSNSVYVGRPSKWGNPFVVGKDGSREEVLERFRDYILSSELMGDIHELQGKDLVCWCSPLGCHADILTKLAHEKTFAVAEWNGHKHEPIPDTERWLYLVQYIAGAEGWNCVSTNATAFYSLSYSYRARQQGFGRIDRLNTPYKDLYYYTLLSDAKIDQAILEALTHKRDFNENAFIKDKK